jgi:Domain of unknown function (DUF4328)
MTAGLDLEAAKSVAAKRARWTARLLTADVLLAALAILAGFFQLSLLQRIAGGEAVSEGETGMSDTIYGGIGLLQMLALVATGILWLMWLHRAYGNLFLVGRRTADWTPRGAVGYWFAPIINLIWPYRIVKELWLRSADGNVEPSVKELPAPGIVSLWWAIWILNMVVGRILFRRSMAAEEVESLIEVTWLGLLDDLGTVVAGILAILIVRRIQQLQAAWPPDTASVFE